ncbi:MAG: hypothetical protein LBI44_05165 [Oscillospiraceae bacterium]|nr:hypothetical protein [Oscillospiraceae bacterium]
MKSVGVKLTVIMVSVILTGVVVTAGIAMGISGDAIRGITLEKLQAETRDEAHQTDGWLTAQMATITALANVLSQKGDDIAALGEYLSENPDTPFEPALQPMLKAVMDENELYFEVYFGFPNGRAQTASGYIFITRAVGRPWLAAGISSP